MTLSELLRHETRAQHSSAESMAFVTHLMRGELSLEHYRVYLTNLAFVYQALEAQTQSETALPSSELLWDQALVRSDSIAHDLRNLGIEDWPSETPTAATSDYVRHLQGLNGRADVKTIAHHYTRYLGDLSGGQAISQLVQRHYGATKEQLSFYRFDGIDDLVRYKEKYRLRLNQLQLTTDQRDELVAEAQTAFNFAQLMFADLGA